MSAARHGKRWTPEEHQTMLDACKNGETISNIANATQRTTLAIEWRLVECVRKAIANDGMSQDAALAHFGIRQEDYEAWQLHMTQFMEFRHVMSLVNSLADMFGTKLFL